MHIVRRAALAVLTAIILVLGYIPVLLRDLAGLAGGALITYGAWLIYQPAAYIVGGLILLTASVLASRGVDDDGAE